MTISKKHLVIGLVLALALIAVQGVGAADGEIIYACANARGIIRMVDDTASCLASETPLQWNVQGEQGPPGPQGPQGPEGSQGPAGLAPSQFVMLESILMGEEVDFKRNLPDGTPAQGVFRVPEGMVLIVTDVDWQQNSGTPGARVILRLYARPLDGEEEPGVPVFESTVILNSEGDGGISEAMSTGFAVSSEARLDRDVWGDGITNHTVIRGYLVPAEE